MKNLIAYINEVNQWDAIFGHKTIDPEKLTQADADSLFDKIDGALSPENLCCDGEASPAYVRKRAAMLNGALKDLKAAGFKPPRRY